MSSYLASLTSIFGGLPSLPSLPSLPGFPSLPQNIQRRFVSFVLKRSLGHLVKAGALDPERLEAQVGTGLIEIRGAELDEEAINRLISEDIPLRLTSGSLGTLTAQIPWSSRFASSSGSTGDPFSTSTSDPSSSSSAFSLSASISHVHLAFELQTTASSHAEAAATASSHVDLAASVATVTDDFLRHELTSREERELVESIHSLRTPTTDDDLDPFFSPKSAQRNLPTSPIYPPQGLNDDDDDDNHWLPPGSMPRANSRPHASANEVEGARTVLTGLVEGLLARLKVDVEDVRVQIRLMGTADGDQPEVTFELRIAHVRYREESPSVPGASSAKTIRISSPKIVYRLVPAVTRPRTPVPQPRSHSASSCSSSSSSEDDAQVSMKMSQAVFDLRESSIAGESVYASAQGGSFFEAPLSSPASENAPFSPPPPNSALEEGSKDQEEAAVEWRTLVSFGEEQLVLRLTSAPDTPALSSTSPSDPPSPRPLSPPLSLDLYVPPISILLLPSFLSPVLHAIVPSLSSSHSQHIARRPSPPPSPLQSPAQSRVDFSLRIKSILVIMFYHEEPMDPSLETQFWKHPTGGILGGGELDLWIDDVRTSYQTSPSPQSSPHIHSSRPSPLVSHPSHLLLTIRDIAVFEHLAQPSPAPAAALAAQPSAIRVPVLIFDSNLPLQYDLSRPDHFPEIEHLDWRGPSAGKTSRDRSWKVRVPRRTAFGTERIKDTRGALENVPVLRINSNEADGGFGVDLSPMHLFLDLTVVERLLPSLRIVTRARQSTSLGTKNIDDDLTPPSSPHRQPAAIQRTFSTVLDDLESENLSSGSAALPTGGEPSALVSVRCPLVRAEVRCPAAAVAFNGEGIGDGSLVRSGILIMDIHQLDVKLGASLTSSSQRAARSASTSFASQTIPRATTASTPPPPHPSFSTEWNTAVLLFTRATENRAKTVLVVGLPPPSISSDPYEADPLLPRIQLLPSPSCRLEIRIPSVRTNLHKATVEGLVYFADDITQWLDGTFGDGSSPRLKDDIKLIGSRFFGPPPSSRGASSTIWPLEDDRLGGGGSAPRRPGATGAQQKVGGDTVLALEIFEVDLLFHAERLEPTIGDNPVRVLHLSATGLDVLGQTASQTNRNETILSIAVADLVFEDVSKREASVKILSKTINRSLELTPVPLLDLRFVSTSFIDSSAKETDVRLLMYNCTAFVTKDIGWVTDLASFAKAPDGVFEDAVPSEVMRIDVQLKDTALHLAAPTSQGALVVSFSLLGITTELISEVSTKVVDVSGAGARVFLIDNVNAPLSEKEQRMKPLNGPERWKQLGYAQMIELATFRVAAKVDPEDEPQMSVDISQIRVKVTACPDSLVTIGSIAGDIGTIFSKPDVARHQPSRPQPSSKTGEMGAKDLLDSLEEDAFKQQPSIVADADFIDDDLPRNTDFLRPTHPDVRPETLKSFEIVGDTKSPFRPGLISDVEGETIRLLDPEGIQVVEDYWSSLSPDDGKDPMESLLPTTFRLRVRDCDVSLLLHDGFDWHHTRKSIEDEIKVVRRRLEKIRQLLASGQTPDESIEQASTTLFNSIYIGAPQFPVDTDASGYLGALGDDDLLDLGTAETGSLASSFQSVRGRGDGASPSSAAASAAARTAKSKKRKLTRSKHARIEINLARIAVAVSQHPIGSELASSTEFSARDLEVLDHIKTSTWKKFLTEMRADSKGNVREAGSQMVTIELKTVRPIPDQPIEEGRLRARILPLRLHVDQDALDFLKRFFSFEAARPEATPPIASQPKQEAYLQHIEIYPIELKLDYKPKRVDYRALREGKTIELMNFFHFDGAEMTLRRIHLSGITGWPRLFDTLNDLWTPDVKANQLAEIISGVSPIRSLVNVGSGVADLILLPLEQYKKDGRIVRGVQRGTTSFVRSTALEAIKLGARLATGTQVILEKAETVLGGHFGSPITAEMIEDDFTRRKGSPGRRSDDEDEEDVGGTDASPVSRYANQPADVKEGIESAYRSLSRNINSAAETILAVPMEVYERKGTNGPVRAVVRAIPIAVLKPMIGASEAVSKTLFGLRNSLDPDARQEQDDKYK